MIYKQVKLFKFHHFLFLTVMQMDDLSIRLESQSE